MSGDSNEAKHAGEVKWGCDNEWIQSHREVGYWEYILEKGGR